jgi:hypothetical protein
MSHLKQWSLYPVISTRCGPQIVSGCFEESQLSRQYPRHYTVHPIFSRDVLQQIYFLLVGMRTRLLAGRPNSRVSIPARDKRFFSSSESPDRLQPPPPSILLSWYSCQIKQPDLQADQSPPPRITCILTKYSHGAYRIGVAQEQLCLPWSISVRIRSVGTRKWVSFWDLSICLVL